MKLQLGLGGGGGDGGNRTEELSVRWGREGGGEARGERRAHQGG